MLFWLIIIGVFCVFLYNYKHKKHNVRVLLNCQSDIDKLLTNQNNFIGSNREEGFIRSIKPECFTIAPQQEGFAKVKVGANVYKIHEDLENPVEAAKTMDKLNTVALELINYMYVKYIKEPAGVSLIKPEYKDIVIKGIKSTKKNFITANLEENIPERSGGDTSYVIDKGEVFAMCLRDPKNANKIDLKFNDLTFVLIHEMSHLFCREYQHTTLFWENFKFVLQEAVLAGLYAPVDYKKYGSPYCGIVISYSPLFDRKLVEYHK